MERSHTSISYKRVSVVCWVPQSDTRRRFQTATYEIIPSVQIWRQNLNSAVTFKPLTAATVAPARRWTSATITGWRHVRCVTRRWWRRRIDPETLLTLTTFEHLWTFPRMTLYTENKQKKSFFWGKNQNLARLSKDSLNRDWGGAVLKFLSTETCYFSRLLRRGHAMIKIQTVETSSVRRSLRKPYSQQFILFVTYNWVQKTRFFIPGKLFQPSAL